jgi:outer membrane protein, heavy metal efflux system
MPGSIAVALLCAGAALAQAPLTEREYVERVLSVGLEARVVEAEAALARAESVGAGRLPNPSVGWQRERAGSGARAGETQDIFAVSVPLVLSGRLGLEREAARSSAGAGEARAAQARSQLTREATRAFAALLAAGQRLRILETSHAELRTLAQAIAARERSGDAAGYDRLRIELEMASTESLMHAAHEAEREAQAQALRLLGPQVRALPEVAGELPAARPLPDVAALQARLAEARADLRALSLEAQGAQAAARASGRRWIPEPTVTAGAQLLDVGREGEGRGYVVGLSVPLPLFEHGQRESASAQARARLAEARHEALLHSARLGLDTAAHEAEARRERLQRHRTEVLARAEELRRIAGAAYRGGASDLLVLVDAERAAREARLAAIDLGLAVVDAETELLLLAGAYDTRAAEPRSTNR